VIEGSQWLGIEINCPTYLEEFELRFIKEEKRYRRSTRVREKERERERERKGGEKKR
jgi:hypothetical protein